MIVDIVCVLFEFIDVIMICMFEYSKIEEFVDYVFIFVINGLIDDYYFCQVLVDLLMIYEYKKLFEGLKVVYVGDGNNVVYLLMIVCVKMGIDILIGCFDGYELKDFVIVYVYEIVVIIGVKVMIIKDFIEVVKNVDVIYVDVWISMGQEEEVQ